MAKSNSDPSRPEVAVDAHFRSTHWSLIARAGDEEADLSAAALEELCGRYWGPLYAFARRRGQSAHDAQDSVQGFFAKLLEKGYVKAADRNKGRFRTFLLAAFKAYSANEWDKSQTQKRGGGREHVPWDWGDAEERFAASPSSAAPPEIDFDRRWALTLIDRADCKLEQEYARVGKLARYHRLKAFLLDDPDSGAYAAAAESLGLSESGVRSSVMRLRHRFSQVLRDEVADTVAHESDLENEMRHLLTALSA